MDVIRHGVYLDNFLFFVCDDARDIAMKLDFVFFWNKGLSAFDCEDDVYINLGVGVGHREISL